MKKRGGGGSRQVTVLDVAQCNYLNPGQINGIHHGALKKFHRCWVPLQQPFELQIRFFPVQSYRHNAKTITATDSFWIFFSFAFFLSFFFLFIIFSVYTSLVHKVLEKKHIQSNTGAGTGGLTRAETIFSLGPINLRIVCIFHSFTH